MIQGASADGASAKEKFAKEALAKAASVKDASVKGASARGAFVCIVGPSGAGKDSLLMHARSILANDPAIVFPRRLVTREHNDAEDHDSISREAYEAGVREGAFCLHWEAHGLGYALPMAVREAVEGGKVVVCNVSRAIISEIFERFDNVHVVLITAPPTVIMERLRQRGRESGASIDARMERSKRLSAVLNPDLTIMNTGPVEIGGERLSRFLRRVAEKCAVVREGV
ncbi:phosphonate metabolism protein/1,5-bisphosphokinase (PRPP-forming) PhnN [Pseudochelatococcus contaminans]|uniref:ribose 1,5-bisphosphate phosphokinase n=1 Tax=Pseudochelatococcus contaminans TaxID=1538103 RepID=A0A7W6EFS7_9HYPH|nr:phosphonate metabolism protein/1,5-bisphosphokinase (PRPP-forming) PhnN [Pseudochelatococcus contaminans]MBB3808971.1 ribose 1,5-bisphosphokinase [Pseudochelatococcus contaminans]